MEVMRERRGFVVVMDWLVAAGWWGNCGEGEGEVENVGGGEQWRDGGDMHTGSAPGHGYVWSQLLALDTGCRFQFPGHSGRAPLSVPDCAVHSIFQLQPKIPAWSRRGAVIHEKKITFTFCPMEAL